MARAVQGPADYAGHESEDAAPQAGTDGRGMMEVAAKAGRTPSSFETLRHTGPVKGLRTAAPQDEGYRSAGRKALILRSRQAKCSSAHRWIVAASRRTRACLLA